jgi:hypothetical protein
MVTRKSVRPKSKRPSATKAKVAVMDTLVQSSTVAVFHACGVAVAPLEPVHLEYDEIALEFPVGAMAFKGPGIDAALILSLPKAVNARLDIWRRAQQDVHDALRELTNLVMGRLKNRLTLYQVDVTSSLPMCRGRRSELDSILPKGGICRAYRFRTLEGNVIVGLKGTVDESRLVYSSTIKINTEGDIIVF